MGKMKLEFDLETERREAEKAFKAADAHLAIWDIYSAGRLYFKQFESMSHEQFFAILEDARQKWDIELD